MPKAPKPEGDKTIEVSIAFPEWLIRRAGTAGTPYLRSELEKAAGEEILRRAKAKA